MKTIGVILVLILACLLPNNEAAVLVIHTGTCISVCFGEDYCSISVTEKYTVISFTFSAIGKKRSAGGDTLSDMLESMEEEKEKIEQNFSMEELFLDADTDCDGYLDSCEWSKFEEATMKDFMEVLDLVNSTDERLSREEFVQLPYKFEVDMSMQMPMDDMKKMIEEEMEGDDDEGPKDRKRP